MVYIEVLNEAKGAVEEILRERGVTNPPPRTAKQIVTETGIGFVGGVIVGYICRKVGKMAFSTIGGGITCISSKSFISFLHYVACRVTFIYYFVVLGQLGYLKVDWHKVQTDYNKLKQRNPDLDLSRYPIKEIVKENLPLATGIAGGTFMAIGQ